MKIPQQYYPTDARNLFESILKGEAGKDAINIEIERIKNYDFRQLNDYLSDLINFDNSKYTLSNRKELHTFDNSRQVGDNLHYVYSSTSVWDEHQKKEVKGETTKHLFYFRYLGYSEYIEFCKLVLQVLTEKKNLKKTGTKSQNSFKLNSKGKAKYLKDVHESLINEMFIDDQTKLIKFRSIFSGEIIGSENRIKWIKSIGSLVYFIKKLHDPELNICKENAHLQTALKCFVIRRNNRYNDLTISQLSKSARAQDPDRQRINKAIKPLIKVNSMSVK